MGDWDGHCGLVRCCFWRLSRLSAAALALALPAPGGTALRFNGGAADRVDLDKQIGAGTECDQALEFGKRFRINNNIAEFHAVNAEPMQVRACRAL